MNLSHYLSGRGMASALARGLGVPAETISQWRNGVRAVPIERCPDVERLTDGAVTRIDLRPDDWWRIWPELAALHPERVPEPTPAPAEPAAARAD